MVTFGESSAKVESTTRSCSASEAEMHGARVVSRREAGHWSSGHAHQVGCVALKLLNVRLHTEPRRSRLVVDQGTRGSRAATALSPAPSSAKGPARWAFAPVDRPPGRADVDLRPRRGFEPGHHARSRAHQFGLGHPVTTTPGVGGGRVMADGRISLQTMPSTLEVALKALGRGSS